MGGSKFSSDVVAFDKIVLLIFSEVAISYFVVENTWRTVQNIHSRNTRQKIWVDGVQMAVILKYVYVY